MEVSNASSGRCLPWGARLWSRSGSGDGWETKGSPVSVFISLKGQAKCTMLICVQACWCAQCTWVFTVSSAQMCVYLGNWNEKALGSLRRTWIFMHGSNVYKAARLWSCGKLKPKPSSGLHGRTGPHCSRLFVSRSFILTRLRPRCVSSHPT